MKEKILKVTHFGELPIGESKTPCYVLEDGQRVLSGRGVQELLKLTDEKDGRFLAGSRLKRLFNYKAFKPIFTKKLDPDQIRIIKCRKGQTLIHGYEPTLLVDLCDAIIEVKNSGVKLTQRQQIIAMQAEVLIRAVAKVGIIALIDEATGYQEIRDRLALQKILDKYLTDEWAKWSKTFPDDFYKHLFRLKNLPYPPPTSGKRPKYVGHWTNDIIYSRLAPGVLKALKEKTPRLPSGTRIRKFHQSLTRDYGHPALKELLTNVIFLMKSCTLWSDFKRRLNRVVQKYGDTIPMELNDEVSSKEVRNYSIQKESEEVTSASTNAPVR
jgi:hypothetical protein